MSRAQRRSVAPNIDPDAPLVRLENLRVVLPTGVRNEVDAVRKVDLVVRKGERVGIVGESGSGKSVTGRAIAGLLPTSPRVRVTGSIQYQGAELVGASPATWATIRREHIGMIFQDPLTFLNPTMKVGKQVAESIPRSRAATAQARLEAVHHFLQQAGLDNPKHVAQRFPHELSGGMRQRVLIALALAKRPDLLIADEPTTALDVTVQQHVLKTIDTAVTELGTSLIFISHDIAVVAAMTDRIYVMYSGTIVEEGRTADVLNAPQHPYTKALLRSVRSLVDDGPLYSIPSELRQSFRQEAVRSAS